MLRLMLSIAAALALFAAPAPIAAQDAPPDTLLTVDRYLDWERVGDPRIAPDGSQVIYTRRSIDRVEDRWTSELWIMNADGTRKRFFADGSNARWSPDGRRVAYLAEGEPEGTQIFVRWLDGDGQASQVTRVPETPADLAWSPDGRRIAFTMPVPDRTPDEAWSIDLPRAPEGASWTEAPRIVEDLHYRQDRRGFMKDAYRHLFVVSADGGTPRRLTYGDWNVGARGTGLDYGAGIDWTPDGRTIVFDGLRAPDADMRYRESHILAVDVATREVRRLTERRGPWSNPVVSPDGRTIAFTGYEWTDQSYKADELYTIGIDGSGMRSLTRELDRSPRDLHWASDGAGIYFTVGDRGTRNVHHVTTEGDIRTVTEGSHTLSLGTVSDGGVAVGVRSSFHEPGDVVRLDLRTPSEIAQLTRVNDDVLADVRLGEVEEVWYRSTDGARIQGWIVKPPSFDPDESYPLILHIHGGPHAMYDVDFSFAYQNYAANGYVVLYTNPRGSTGYGTEFGNAIDEAYPSVDYEDLMAGVDTVVGRGYIDTDNLFVTGCSGGGVLSSWVVGHTDRFAAAAVRCPVTNWMSFAGTADIALWAYHRFGGYPWDDADEWLEHSPLMYVGNVSTPTLLMTGELDLRTPMAQSEEYYAALKMLGVPTALIRFNGEYHGTGSKPSNFMRTQLYIMRWFGRHGALDRLATQSEND